MSSTADAALAAVITRISTMLTQRTKTPRRSIRTGLAMARPSQHPDFQNRQQQRRQRAHRQLIRQQALQDDRDDDADGDRPARFTPGLAPPGGQVAHVVLGLVLDVLGPGHQCVPDRVPDLAGALGAEHPAAAGRPRRTVTVSGSRRCTGRPGRRTGRPGGVPAGPAAAGPPGGAPSGPAGPSCADGLPGSPVPAGGSGSIYPLLTWPGRALAYSLPDSRWPDLAFLSPAF